MQVEQTAGLHRGSSRVPADGIVTRPLGYLRDEIEPGRPLPEAPTGELRGALDRCDEVILTFDGKLGDTLLAFGAAAAVLSYLELTRPDQLPIIRTNGPHRGLFNQLTMLDRFEVRSQPTSRTTARAVVVGDRQGLSTSRSGASRILFEFECDPEEPSCWSSGQFAYPFLPARYFLSVERQLGVRLADRDGFMPTLTTADAPDLPRSSEALAVGIVTATSWPVRKDYGAPRFLDALRSLAPALDRPIHAVVVPGKEGSPLGLLGAESAGLTIEVMGDAHYLLVAERLAACDLVIGNDTGLTHLAAATRLPDSSGPQVIGLYARHSHTKWRTGFLWHHALATPFSESMHREDRCPVRDRIDDRQFGSAAEIGSIRAGTLADAAQAVLTLGLGADQ